MEKRVAISNSLCEDKELEREYEEDDVEFDSEDE